MTFMKKSISVTAAQLMLLVLTGNAFAGAQDHVVNAAELHKSLVQASQARQAELDKLSSFFGGETAKGALQRSGMSPAKVLQAVSSLDDEELARLAERADKVNKDFAAGALSNQQLTYIVIALATAVIILVLIEA